MIIKTSDIISPILTKCYNKSKTSQLFPMSLKKADILPIHKKDEKFLAKNYRPISLLPAVSKIYEKNMYEEIIEFIEKSLSPYLFGFRKGHSTEQCLLVMLETWKVSLDENGYVGAILTDLSKAFDCLNHDLLIAKLDAYGFNRESLSFVQSYLKNRVQRTKVGSNYSMWLKIKYGIPQGSILGPLLFNIFMNDIFYFIKDASIASYADDTTPNSTNKHLSKLLDTLKQETNLLLKWFTLNEMKPNADKCHLMITNSHLHVY